MNKRYTLKRKILTFVSRFLVVILVVFSANLNSWTAHAANLTSLSDNLTRLNTSTLASHVIQFVSPTGLDVGKTAIFTFGTAFTVGTFVQANYAFLTGSTNVCSTATFTAQALQATPDTSHWGIGSTGNVVTLTAEAGAGVALGLTTNKCVRLVMGNNATNNPGGTAFITNGATAGDSNATLSVTGTFGDIGSAFIPLLSNDQVTLTATVNPTLSFTLSTNSLAFGTLTTANGRWAVSTTGASTPTVGLTLTAATNGAAGYTIYVVGPTLTDSAISATIAAMGASAVSAPGTAQFGLNAVSAGGTGTVSSPYGTTSQYAYTATTTETPVATDAAPAASDSYSISYLANISAITQSGAYTTTHTWTATANF